MGTPLACPKCGASYLTGAHICDSGHKFSEVALSSSAADSSETEETAALADSIKPITLERPFDIGKPLGTKYSVSQACPACGSIEYKAVKADAMIAFASDRMCRMCSTRYTPPT